MPAALAQLDVTASCSQQPESFLMHPAALDAGTHTAAALADLDEGTQGKRMRYNCLLHYNSST